MGTITMPDQGVQLNAPPKNLIGSVTKSIEDAVAMLPPGKNQAFVAVADLSGTNAAFVKRWASGWKVEVFVGKVWHGPTEAGAKVLKSW